MESKLTQLNNELKLFSFEKIIPVGNGRYLTGVALTDDFKLAFVLDDDSILTTSASIPTLEFDWRESELGVRVSGDTDYQYVDLKGQKGDAFTYADFTPTQLNALKGQKGDAFTYADFTPTQLNALKGQKGDAFTYADFTPTQLNALKGLKGDAFTYADFTPTQLNALKGQKGDAFTYADFTPTQLNALKGQKGDAFTYGDFTQDQLDNLTVNGKNLEFNWLGTQLGVRIEGDANYQYVDLKGEPGSGSGTPTTLKGKFPIWAEENNFLNAGTYEWAFGNGADTPPSVGVVIAMDCELTSMHLRGPSGDAEVRIVVDGIEKSSYKVEMTLGKGNADFSDNPLSIAAESRITFKTVSALNTNKPNIITAWFDYHLTA